MECNTCEEKRTKLYCTKCIKEGLRQQKYQIHAVSRKRDEALGKVKDHLSSEARHLWQVHAERDEKKIVIGIIRQELEQLQGVIRKGLHLGDLTDTSRETTAGERQDGRRNTEKQSCVGDQGVKGESTGYCDKSQGRDFQS